MVKVPWDLCQNVIKLRCCNHKLEIETGRYYNIERYQRHCKICSLNRLGDEYHLFFECNNEHITRLRNQYIPLSFRENPSMYKFTKLLQKLDDIKLAKKIGKFLRYSNVI